MKIKFPLIFILIKKWLPEVLVTCAILTVVRYGFAQSWTESLSNAPIQSVALSADGKKAMAVPSGDTGYISTNYGNAWQYEPVAVDLSLIAASADGQNMVGVFAAGASAFVSVSTNAGNTWAPTASPKADWRSCACSSDGRKLVAAIYGGLIYTSTNAGTTWKTNSVSVKYWKCLASSADGTKLAAGAYNDQIYTSSNSGLSWAAPAGSPTNSWWSIASSADGYHLVATGLGGTYISSDAGANWITTNLIGTSAASSADGSRLIVCNVEGIDGLPAATGQVFTSTNFGIDWATNDLPAASWQSVASSADGNELLAGQLSGVWVWQATPSPQLSLAQSSGNLALTWLVPATNFVVQQSPDLISWSSLTDQPALNLTNLNYGLSVAPSNTSGFFRLVAQ